MAFISQMRREVAATLHSPPIASIVPPSETSTAILPPLPSREMHEYREGPIVSVGPTATGSANALSERPEASLPTSILATQHPPHQATIKIVGRFSQDYYVKNAQVSMRTSPFAVSFVCYSQ